MACVFCNLLQTERGIDYEDSYFWGRFDIHPVTPGHLILISKRHIVDLQQLSRDEWISLRGAIERAISFIESFDKKRMRAMYEVILDARITPKSVEFVTKALAHPRFGTRPDCYNHGINDGKAAGRTVEHLHWHIIPRYHGDMPDPRGGVRHVIPEMGNYNI